MCYRFVLAGVLACMSLFGQGQGRGIPGATEQQLAAVGRLNSALAPLAEAATAARVAELALASARAEPVAKPQASPDRFAPNQIAGAERKLYASCNNP